MGVPKDPPGPLTLFDMGGHDGPQNVFDHCVQTLSILIYSELQY